VADRASPFDPYELLAALEARRVSYVVIGAFARVIRGTGEVTDGLDITFSTRDENLVRLARAVDDVEGRGRGGQPVDPSRLTEGVLEVDTRVGELKLVPVPAGTRGYDDIRRHASREPLGQGLRPQVASSGDLARMLGALEREDQIPKLLRLRRLIELERTLTLDRGIHF
jgi:hypothetical protein